MNIHTFRAKLFTTEATGAPAAADASANAMAAKASARQPQARRLATCLSMLAAAAMLLFAMTASVHAQARYATPTAAMNAFGDAILKGGEEDLKIIFGQNFRTLIPVLGTKERTAFAEAWAREHTAELVDPGHARIAVGGDGWTFPVPLVKTDDKWSFDTRAGAEEMRVRRIGRNELAVIQTMLAIFDAQREYAQTPHDGGKLLVYAAKLVSAPGKHDGLYWPTQPGDPPSPLGEDFVHAVPKNAQDAGFLGYHFKLLESQGPHAPGGAYDYVVQGKLFGGFAVIAWPVKYGDTGIKTFMVSHAGQLYQSDLGPDSATKAQAIRQFDPGEGWSKVPEQDMQ